MEFKLQGDVLTMTLDANLVAANLDRYQAETREVFTKYPEARIMEFDLANVTEIDSLGINLVVAIYKEISGRGLTFRVTNSSRQIKNLFKLFKLSSYFEVA
jgi:anti-sigma B factor antagonist